jgi:ribosome assembly protein 1
MTVSEKQSDEAFYKEAEAAYFSPEKGNIVFCSAIDCWSFRLSDFAEIFAEKLEIRKDVCYFQGYGK